MNEYADKDHINVGTGEDISIQELANKIKDMMGFKGEIFGTDQNLMAYTEKF